MSVQPSIESGLDQLGLAYSAEQLNQLSSYIALLVKWNQTFNLIAKLSSERILTHHIFDSLVAAPFIRGVTLLDIGSGGGLPGIPLAIMRPDLQAVLLDSNGKKTRFLTQALIELSLTDRVSVIKSRIEEYRPAQPFDTVVSRAFASLGDFIESSFHVCDQQSVLLAMKGRRPDEELRLLTSQVKVTELAAVTVPGVEAERHIICLQKR